MNGEDVKRIVLLTLFGVAVYTVAHIWLHIT
jgi:hypothetical protein